MPDDRHAFLTKPSVRLAAIAGLTLALIAITLLLPPIPQDLAYHHFVDQRAAFNIPNFADVVSNLPFLLVGTAGLLFLWRQRHASPGGAFVEPAEKWPYIVFFAGVALTGLGSAYYHLAPDNQRLVWDRLPLSLVFTSFCAAVVANRISAKAGLIVLLPLATLGLNSVIYWYLSEINKTGDLRLYLMVQAYPVLLTPLVVWLFPARYTRSADLLGVIALYAAAKVGEVFDARIFSLGHLLSGHTLKHLAAAGAVWWLLRMLRRRRPVLRDGP